MCNFSWISEIFVTEPSTLRELDETQSGHPLSVEASKKLWASLAGLIEHFAWLGNKAPL